ncbi:response regulator transcription factor [Olsenella uli]|nr:response regulator transcription factor [Olsenella uli]
MDVTREGHRDAPLILIVDDEADIADMLESYFRLEGYRTLVACDAAGAIEAAGRAPDAILLDVNLPDADGFSVCRTIRELVACPIIFLTARVEDADAIAGFAAGGDDYVTKPFSLEVLGARVRAQLAREHRRLDRATVRFPGGIAVDFARREVRVATDGGGHGERVATLARKDFDIVALLARRPGQVFDRDMIYERVWGEPGDSSVVTEHVRRVRRALAEAGCATNPLATVWGVGYSWRA